MSPHPFSPSQQDEFFLRRALELARENVERGDGGPFGAVIVQDEHIIAEGWNKVIAARDPTAHAEIEAIRAACQRIQHFHLQGATLYASSEPCPLCLAAAYWARVARIVYANDRNEAAAVGFCDDDLYEEFHLPPESRRIPCQHLKLTHANAPFEAWRTSPRRQDY
ncbi:MAG: nucleoside deaminase [Zoogloeaceae bacterium]|jgi:tRNA(Arg) A34 adenosine deaminase TadA|nr:nucleoside deaminase [Zoogloeaceae bacterium]